MYRVNLKAKRIFESTVYASADCCMLLSQPYLDIRFIAVCERFDSVNLCKSNECEI